MGDLTWVVGEALAGGADVIQYREKGVPDRELLRRRRELRILTAQARVPLIMNDRVDLARLASCDGVHVGQDDVSVRDARRIMGTDRAHRRLDPRPRAARCRDPGGGQLPRGRPGLPQPDQGILGARARRAGLYVRLAAETTALPWFAIGGINEENIDRVLEAGATRIAVSAAVLRADSPRRATQRLKARLSGVAVRIPTRMWLSDDY